MNAQNFTQKSIEALQGAQNLAQTKRSSNIAPEHLLYALFGDHGITKSSFAAELSKVKSGPVTGENP